MIPRKWIGMEPACVNGAEKLLGQCCEAALQPRPHNHLCFGAWDPTYGHAEMNFERCCANAYQESWRRSQPVLAPLPRLTDRRLHCFPCGNPGVQPCLICVC